MLNYENKAKALSLGLDKDLREISKAYYADFVLHEHGLVAYAKYTKEQAEEKEKQLFDIYGEDLCKEGMRLNDSFYHRKLRLQNRINDMLAKDCLFLTLTFTDKVLQKTTKDTRRQHVRRFLRQFGCKYIANIDFGDKNNREHYHAIIQISEINAKLWDYGAINFKPIVVKNEKALSKYIAKLRNHAIKETARVDRIIYSR